MLIGPVWPAGHVWTRPPLAESILELYWDDWHFNLILYHKQRAAKQLDNSIYQKLDVEYGRGLA